MLEESSDVLLPAKDLAFVDEWMQQPLLQKAAAHWRAGLIYHAEQAAMFGAIADAASELQIPPGDFIQLHIAAQRIKAQRGDVV